MEQSYINAVTKKLKKQGFSDEEIVVKIKNIINPNIMEPEIKEEEVVDEVNMPVEEEEKTPVVEENLDTEEEVA